MAISEALFLQRPARRTLRLAQPGLQLRLAGAVLAVTLGYGLLFGLNTYGAFGRLYTATLSWAPSALGEDIGAQAQSYLRVSLALFLALATTLGGVCVAVLHRVLGPTVALERSVRALARGDYSQRVVLREGEIVFATLAQQLNTLADRLEAEELARTSYAGSRRVERNVRGAPRRSEIPLSIRALSRV